MDQSSRSRCDTKMEVPNNKKKNDLGQAPREQTPQSSGQEQRDSFCWKGEQLLYPETGKDINGDPMPMCSLSAVEFCEASDLYLTDALGYAPLITGLFCRPAGDAYDELRARQRAQTMQNLPMTVVLRLFGLLDQAHRYLQQQFPHCYAPQGIRQRGVQSGTPSGHAGRHLRALSPPTWNDMLFEVAGYRPGEIAITGQMNLYDFMRLLNAKCKRNRHSLF